LELEVSAGLGETWIVKGYGQFCPVARASEVLAERWTPIIVRNLLLGCTTFNEIASGAPGLSRALLTRRLRELQRAGVIEISPKSEGHGSVYELTQAGRELWDVLRAMGGWAQKWMEVTPSHSDPDVVLWSWCHGFLRHDRLPDGRVLVRFEFPVGRKGRPIRVWLLVEGGEAEICSKNPGFEEDLVVAIADPQAFSGWHLGFVQWEEALRSGGIRVDGRRDLARALPTWNAGPQIHAQARKEHSRVPNRIPSPNLYAPGPPSRLRASPSPPFGDGAIPGFDGWVLTPADAGYDEARTVWNGAIDRRPAFIAGCRSPDDVASALRFARERGLPVAVRSGGHGVAGTSVCDDGVVIDLSAMKAIQVDPQARTARAGAGLLWGELDAATQVFGLATTGGTMSQTGIAGLTLGGGIGWLMRRHGLTVDNLLSVDVVLADGRTVTADEHEHPDLFWAIRGGGGNFGVVTSFTYRLHPVGPEVLAGPVIWALEDAPEVLRFYREFADKAPREVNTVVAMRKAPPLPFLPVELHERPVCIVAMLSLGDPVKAERAIAPMRGFGRPLLDMVNPRLYTGLQSIFDAGVPHGWHYYWKSAEVGPLEDPIIDTMVEHSWQLRSPWSYMVMFQLGGAVADVGEDATAYSNRPAAHNVNVNGVWLPHQPIGDHETEWTRAFSAALEPHQTGVYLNFLDRDDQERVRTAFGDDTYRRLGEIKGRYDPENVFRANDNIRPPARTDEHLVAASLTPLG
jgi:FAD/FMN-containing dehydrogenase/DNA-binding HxlR family transcriptional regulator